MNFKKNKFYFKSLVVFIYLLLSITVFSVFAGPGDDLFRSSTDTAGPGKDLALALPSTNTTSPEKYPVLPLQDADINALNEKTKTLLMYMAEEGDYYMVNYWIEKGVDVNEQDEFGNTAFTFAHKNSHSEVADLLLKKMAPINDFAVLLLASKNGDKDTVATSLEIENYKTDDYLLIALNYACENNHGEIKKLLAKKILKKQTDEEVTESAVEEFIQEFEKKKMMKRF